MLNKHNTYIITSIIIGFFILTLAGWALFLGKEGKSIEEATQNTDYLTEVAGGNFEFSNSMFGKVVEEAKNAITKEEEVEIFTPVLMQLHLAPVAGTFVPSGGNSDADSVYFAERSAGHVFKITLADDKPKTQRVLHTTIPGVQEVLWSENGEGVIRRYMDDEDNVVSAYNFIPIAEDSEMETESTYLVDNMSAIAASPSGKSLFYIMDDEDGARGYISRARGEDTRLIWSSWMRQWHIEWIDETHILITQSPASGMGGAAFTVETEGVNEELILSSVPGLASRISTNGNMLLYSRASGARVSLFVMDIEERVKKEIALATFADKCIWSKENEKVFYCFVPETLPDAQYPDAWYQGLTHFSDKLWKIDAETGEVEMLLSPQKKYNTKIDAEDISISATERYIFFTNRSDQTLWSIKIKEDGKNNEDNKETSQ